MKIFAKFTAVAVACAGLAIFWHAMAMQMPMDADGMTSSCLTVCFGGSAQVAPGMEAGLHALATVVLVILLILPSFAPFVRRIFGFEKKERHRYLMKTMVMLR
jgi:hypothetical protein